MLGLWVSLVTITLGMVLFSYGLLGPVLNDVGILILLPSCGWLLLFNHILKRGAGAVFPICQIWICHLLMPLCILLALCWEHRSSPVTVFVILYMSIIFPVQRSSGPKGMAGVALSSTLQSWATVLLSPEWAAKNVLSRIRGREIFLCALQQM